MSAKCRFEFLCHNRTEYLLAETVDATLPRHLPATPEEYAAIIGRARAGLVSRIHAAIPLAGIGVPSLAIGTDTRLGTLDIMGLRTIYVKQATTDRLEYELSGMLSQLDAERSRLFEVRENAIRTYADLMRNHARSNGGKPERKEGPHAG